MTAVTLDASAALAWLLGQARPHWLDPLFVGDAGRIWSLKAPSLFWLEVGNTLARSKGLTDEQALDGFLRLEALGIETIELDRPLRLRTLQLAREMGLSMYDAAYLALASNLDAPLATLDHRLDTAAQALGLSFGGGSHRVSEKRTTYGSEVDSVSLAALGAALAELRSRYPPA